MARVEYDRHVRVATQPDDGTSDIQPQRDWNGNAHKQQGIVGYIGTSTTLATDAFVLSDALHVITGEGGSPDNLVTITSTDALNHDVVQLLAAAGQTITVKNGSGNIQLQGGVDKVLSTTVRLLLQYDGTNWNEVGNFQAGITSALNTWALKQTFSGVVEVDNQIGINIGTFLGIELIHGVKDGDDAQILLDAYGTGKYNHFIGRAARGSKASPTTLSADDIIASLSGRAYDGTSFSSFGNPVIKLVAAENQSGSAHGTYISFSTTKKTTTTLSEVFRLNDDGSINITNPAFTFHYILTPAAIAANRILNLPLTTGTDTLATLGLGQTFTGNNTFSGTLTSSGGITMSSADITLAGNKIKTTTYQYLEDSGTPEISPSIVLQPITGATSSMTIIAPQSTSHSSGLFISRTSDYKTNYEGIFFGSDPFGLSNSFDLVVLNGGTGSLRPFNIIMSATKLMSFDTANTITSYVNTIISGASLIPNSDTGSSVTGIDASGGTQFTITSGSTATPFGNSNNFAGLFVIQDVTGGGVAFVATGNGNVTIIWQGASAFVQSSSPSASQTGIYLSSSILTLKNGFAVSHNYIVTAIPRIKTTN